MNERKSHQSNSFLFRISDLLKTFYQNRSMMGIDIDSDRISVVQISSCAGQKKKSQVIVHKINFSQEATKDASVVNALRGALEKFDYKNSDIICTLNDQKLVVDHLIMPVMPPQELAQAIKLQVGNSQQYPIENPLIDFLTMDRRIEKNVEKFYVMVVAVAKVFVDSLINKFKALGTSNQLNLKKILLLEDLGDFNLVGLIPPSVAIENLIKKSNISQRVAVLYMGSTMSELNIYQDSKLESSRKINVFNADFTKSLTSAIFSDSGKIELTVPEAQSLRKEFGIPAPSENFLIRGKITANQAVSLLRPRIEQLCKEIQRCFDIYYDRNPNKRIEKIILLGEAALLKRLDEVLIAELGLPVVKGNPLEAIETCLDSTMSQDIESIQNLTLAIGAGLGKPSTGINLLPLNLRNIQQKFIQRLLVVLAVGFALFIVFVIYIGLMQQNNASKKQLEQVKKEYQALRPQADLLKDQLMIEIIVSGRMNYGDLLMQLSNAPREILFTELKIEEGALTLSGLVPAKIKESKVILEAFIQDLMKDSFYQVTLDSVKKSPTQKLSSEFVIKAQLNER